MVNKPKHNVHSFRGLLNDGGQDEMILERQNVNLAYRIIKFQGFPNTPGVGDYESTLEIWREKQTSIATGAPFTVDFKDVDLLGALYESSSGSTSYSASPLIVIFDNTLFSRNIYVTHTNTTDALSYNYYIEIEEVPVTASTLMQLKLGVARKLNLQQD